MKPTDSRLNNPSSGEPEMAQCAKPKGAVDPAWAELARGLAMAAAAAKKLAQGAG